MIEGVSGELCSNEGAVILVEFIFVVEGRFFLERRLIGLFFGVTAAAVVGSEYEAVANEARSVSGLSIEFNHILEDTQYATRFDVNCA